MLYVAISGGIVMPVNGTEFEGRKVFALDTKPWSQCHTQGQERGLEHGRRDRSG